MKQKGFKYIFAIAAILTSVESFAQPMAEQGGFVYELMKDEAEMERLNMSEYEQINGSHCLNIPELDKPFGFTAEYMQAYSDAQPSDGIDFLQLPNSNRMGSACMNFHITLPPVSHNMKPDLQILYNSDLYIGSLGHGWNINLPKITMDTLSYDGNHITYQWNGYPLYDKSNESQDLEQSDYFAIYDNDIAFASRNGKPNDCYWILKDAEGNTHYYGRQKSNKEEDDKNDIISSVSLTDGSKRVIEWYETYAENLYGDYIQYKYNKDMQLDTILMGVKKEEKARIKIVFNWGTLSSSFHTYGYGGEFSIKHKLTSIQVLYVKDFSTANKLPEKETDFYQTVTTYTFEYEKDFLTKSKKSSANLAYSYQFNYYDDQDSVKKYRQFRDEYFNLDIDSLIVDRTGLMKTIHTPFGGCVSLNYGYADKARMLGDTLPDSLFVCRDTLLKYEDNKDTLLINYFHRCDTTKGKLVMTSLWANDAVMSDGHPSLNRFSYEKPIKDSLSHFMGFSSVVTTNMNTSVDTFAPYRKIVKKYDATAYHKLGNLLSVQTINPSNGEILSSHDFDYYNYSVTYKAPDKLAFSENNESATIHFMPLKQKRKTIGRQTDSWYYIYDGSLFSLGYPNLNYAIHNYDKNNGTYDYAIGFDFIQKGNIRPKGLLSAHYLLDSNSKLYFNTEYVYNDVNNPTCVTQMKQYVDDQKFVTTDFQYDADGNMTTRIMPGEDGSRMTYHYLYDRRFNMFINQVTDSYGYRSEYDNYLYPIGKPQSIIDRNGQKLTQKFDAFGRLDTVIAPYEIANDKNYSIRYQYDKFEFKKDSLCEHSSFRDSLILNVPDSIWKNEFPDTLKKIVLSIVSSQSDTSSIQLKDFEFCNEGWPYDTFNIKVDTGNVKIPACLCDNSIEPHKAFTYRYNAMNSQDHNIISCVFADGFGRSIQKQERKDVFSPKDINDIYSVSKKYVVEKTQLFDPYARIVSESYSIANTANEKFLKPQDVTDYLAVIEYDLLDRKTKIGRNNSDSISLKYNNIDGNVQYAYQSSLGSIKYSTTGKLLSFSLPLQDKTYEETCIYDPLGRLISATYGGRTETYQYDLLGRLKEQNKIKDGKTTFQYDKAGNLISKQTSNLNKEGKSIEYKYHYGQLTDIIYPSYPTNNVHIVYGDNNAPFNRVGLPSLITDATGVHEYYYGCQGDVVKNRRTLIIPDGPVETYTTQFEYDTWNRLKKLIYPDGEIVKYSYNVTGLPDSIFGSKAYSYTYVKEIAYDENDSLTHFKYCNGAETYRIYDPSLKFLKLMEVHNTNSGATEPVIFRQYADELARTTEFNTFSQNWEYIIRQYNNNGNLTYESTSELNSPNYIDIKSGYSLTVEYDESGSIEKHTTSHSSNEIDKSYMKVHTMLHKNLSNGLPAYYYETDNEYGDNKATLFSYDMNGNRTSIVNMNIDSYDNPGITLDDNGGSSVKQMSYDDENRMIALDDNGSVSTFWYDAYGNRSLSTQGGRLGLFVNSTPALPSTSLTPNYTMYVNPYFEKNSDSVYVKHIWLNGERMVSKVGDNNSYGSNPSRIERAGASVEGLKLSYDSLYTNVQKGMSERYASLNTEYTETGKTCPSQAILRNANVDNGNDNYEENQYYYHTDRDNNALLITNLYCGYVQQAFLANTGEILSSQNDGTWFSPYFFNGFHYDRLSGFYYKNGFFINPQYDFDYGSKTWVDTQLNILRENIK